MTRGYDHSGLATVPPKEHRWTREEYHAMGRAGLFDGKRVELIEGKVVEMSPIGPKHWVCVNVAEQALKAVFSSGFTVSVKSSVAPDERSEPEPDIAVVPGSARDYIEALPAHAVLIVEAADSSLHYDRTEKASLYAKAGIQDYWIINLIDDQVEVMRGPRQDNTREYGFGYEPPRVFSRGERIVPLAAPNTPVSVDDLLP